MTTKLGLTIAVEEMSQYLQYQFSSMDTIKTNIRAIFGSASLIIAILGGFQLVNVRIAANYLAVYNIGIVLSMIMYIALIVCCVWAISPAPMKGPIAPEWEEINSAFLEGKNENDILQQRLSNYLQAIKLNEHILLTRSHMVTVTGILLSLIVIILLLLSLVPRTPIA